MHDKNVVILVAHGIFFPELLTKKLLSRVIFNLKNMTPMGMINGMH